MTSVGRSAGSKNKVRKERKSMEKYMTGRKKMIVKIMKKIGK